MIHLLLAILCGAALSIVMRLSEGRVKSRMSMLAANYLTCMAMSLCFMGPRAFAPAEGFRFALWLGLLNGFFYMSALVVMQYSIRRNGVVLPSVFSRMGALLLPLLAAILFFGETPRICQVIGFLCSVIAILLMNARGGGKAGSMPLLLLLMFTDGTAAVMSKVYQVMGASALSNQFLFFTFGSALILCLLVIVFKRERFGLMELLFGMAIGVPNFLASRFNLKALESLPSIIVYPSRSVGALLLITVAGLFAFRERLTRRQMIAMAFIFAALILLNL